jgi:hypothetical protein
LQEQEQIVALTTELGKIKDTSLQLACSLSKKQAKSSNKPKSDKKKNNKGKSKSKKRSKHVHTGKWSWKNNAPAQGDPQMKEFRGNAYIWCPTHKEWGTHSHQECREHI